MRRTELTVIAQRVVFTMGILALCSHTTIAETGSVRLLDFTKGDKPRDATESYWLHADGFSGIPNGVEEKGRDANQIYLCSRVAETQGNGILQVGDVLLGVNGTLFEGDVIDTWRAAVAEARCKDGNLRVIRWRNGIRETVDYPTGISTADLTIGRNRYGVDRTLTYNLGPTGMRGWLHLVTAPDPAWYRIADEGRMTQDQPWQILVTAVGTGTPAYGILVVDDVILGAQAGGGAVPLFTNDARKSLGWAIGDAEATNGILSFLINRYGVPTNQTYSIQLKLTNLAYSATAPYNCPKSARILADAVKIISNMTFNLSDAPGNPVLGLAKMAVGITNDSLRTYAQSIAPASGSLNPFETSYYISWDWGYKNLFLTEYFLYTGDTSVTNGIREFAIKGARAQDMYGLLGHYGAENRHDGTYNGSIMDYGPVNSASLPFNMGIFLARKCGISHPDIDAAIDRANKWFGYFVGKGSVPYGEHEPFPWHASNGKNAMAAMWFALQGDKPCEAKYFERMTVASFNSLEWGHTGQEFSYLWSALGAHQGGMTSLYSHLAPMRWHVDLSRRYDGAFVYDGSADSVEYGGSELDDYWGTTLTEETCYDGNDPTTWYVLLFSLPMRKLLITGRDLSPTNQLSVAEVANAVWAGNYSQICSAYSTNELMSHFGEYDPVVRRYAAETVATKPGSNTLVNGLIALTTNDNSLVRATACEALGALKNTAALPALAARMYDTDAWVRSKANAALRDFGAAAIPQLTNMMTAFITNGSLDQYAIDWSDPIRFANGYLANLLFSRIPGTTIGAPTNLLYQAVAVGLAQPDAMARDYLTGFMTNNLNWTNVQMLAPNLVQCAAEMAPANRMFSRGPYLGALLALAKYKVEDGIPLAIRHLDKTIDGDWEGRTLDVLACLSNTYRGSAWEALPALHVYASSISDPPTLTSVWNAIDAIEHHAGPALNCFKSISAARATPTAIALPSSNVTLSCSVNDLDNGIKYYVWSKAQGVGTVTFTPNNSAAASNCTATFSAPGTYVLQMACVDKSILDTSTWNWSGYFWHDFQNYTNILGAVYTNLTVTVHGSSPD